MNITDYETLRRAEKAVAETQAKEFLRGVLEESEPTPRVPPGYVRDNATGTVYKLDTWLKKRLQGHLGPASTPEEIDRELSALLGQR